MISSVTQLCLENTRKIFASILSKRYTKCAEDKEFTEDEIGKFKQLFLKFDRDEDNKLDRWEFSNFSKYVTGEDCNLSDINMIFSRIDTDGDQYITLNEMIRYFEKRFIDQSKKKIVQAFKSFDKDSDGFLYIWEAKAALVHLGEEVGPTDLNEIYNNVDKDKDKKINLKEFVEFICRAFKK